MLLALLLTSAVVVLAASYLDGRYVRVEVRFVQTGLAKAGLLKVEVDCSGPFATPRPGRLDTVDLGWLRRTDLITIQAVRGGGGSFLSATFLVDGTPHSAFHTAGSEFDPPAVTANTGYGTWLVHRTFSASGSELAPAACTGALPATLKLARPVRSTLSGGHLPPGWVLSTVIAVDGALFWVYFCLGVAMLLFVAVAAPVRAGGGRGILGAVVAFGLAFAGVLSASQIAQVASPETFVIIGAVIGCVLGALALLSPELARLTKWLERIARSVQRTLTG